MTHEKKQKRKTKLKLRLNKKSGSVNRKRAAQKVKKRSLFSSVGLLKKTSKISNKKTLLDYQKQSNEKPEEQKTVDIPSDKPLEKNKLHQKTIKKTEKKKSLKKKKPLFSSSSSKKKQVKSQPLETIISTDNFTLSDIELKDLKQLIYKRDGIKNIDEWEELDSYPLLEPFAFSSILKNKNTKEKRYFLIEIVLTDEEKKHLSFIKEAFEVMPSDTNELNELGEEPILLRQVNEIISDYSLLVSNSSKEKIFYHLKKDCLNLGILDPLMKDINIEDVSCDGAGVPIFLYHRIHGSIQSNVAIPDEEVLSSFVMKLAQKCGKHISISTPMLDATMPDGSRIQMTLSTEVSTKGSTFTIRKFKEQPFSPADLIQFNTMSSEMMAYLWLAVQHGSSALISGGTASGKTSVLNAISLFIPRESKIVSIEETREINLPHPNWIPGITRSGFGEVLNDRLIGEIDLFDLMKAALRQRPEYILVGEIRGKEAYVLFQAMATGHTTYSTVHADSMKSLIHRLEGKPINVPRNMLQSLDIVMIQSMVKLNGKTVRRCKDIIEVITVDSETNEFLTNHVFKWDSSTDEFKYTGKSFILETIRELRDLSTDEMRSELKQRQKILEWMHKHMIRDFKQIGEIVSGYTENPSESLAKISSPPKQSLLKKASEIQSSFNVHDDSFSLYDVITSEDKLKKSSHARKKKFFMRLKKNK